MYSLLSTLSHLSERPTFQQPYCNVKVQARGYYQYHSTIFEETAASYCQSNRIESTMIDNAAVDNETDTVTDNFDTTTDEVADFSEGEE